MKRRRSRRRFAGLLVGIAFLAGLTLQLRSIVPELQSGPDARVVSAASAVSSPGETPLVAADTGVPAPAAEPSAVAVDAAAPTVNIGRDEAPPDSVVSDAPPHESTQTVEVLPGDTPQKLLARLGVGPDDAQAAARTLRRIWNPRDLKAGQKAAVLVRSERLLSIRLALAPGREIAVARDDSGGFVAEDQDRPTHEVTAFGAGTIRSSLAGAASRAGVPAGVLAEMIRAFSYDVDFQREVRAGDTFSVLYRRVDDEFGAPTGGGHLLYAEMVLSGARLRLYRFTPKDGEAGYYNVLGENLRKSLLRTPVDAIRITSGFGLRFHPILGYSRMHQGVDFGAPSGTAVYAAGDGVVVFAGRSGGYGNAIEIEHTKQYATKYAHLSGFARGLHEGEHVRQGEVIGYVGMTGLATGPHLHYEVHDHGAPIDPLSIKMPTLTRLAGADLKAFEAARDAIERQLIDLRQDRVARAECRGEYC